jgi:protein required for attachment to host cells
MLGKIKRYQEKEIKEKVIKEIDEIIVYIKDLIEQAKAGK